MVPHLEVLPKAQRVRLERAISTAVLILIIVALTDWSTIRGAGLNFVDRSKQLQIGLLVTGLALLALTLTQTW